MRKLMYVLLTALLIGLGWTETRPVKVVPGERFIGKRGGRIEISLVEGDPLDPIVFKAASSSFFRLKDGEYNILPYLESRPLGYMQDELFYISEWHQDELFYISEWHNAKESWDWKIVEGKGKIEFEISEEVEDQEISIIYVIPLRYKIYISLLVLWSGILLVTEEIFPSSAFR
jgi:hypothetical protein